MTEKLQKILAQAGLGSRREMERWIAAGRVRVNQLPAKIGDRADETALIEVDGHPLKKIPNTSASPAVLIYHKPTGELCTRHDTDGRPTVFDRLPKPPSGRWIMVGRLDYNTSGLLLFTNNGELANRLMHPSFHLKRVYVVRVYGKVTETTLTHLKQGIALKDGKAHFDTIELMDGEGHNQWYKVSISMGKNRIVRRLWESQSVKVNRLIRVEFGPLVLPRTLKIGDCKILSLSEVSELLQAKDIYVIDHPLCLGC